MTSKRAGHAGWRALLHSAGMLGEHVLDHVAGLYERRFPSRRPLQVLTYRGFGNTERCAFGGRVLRYAGPLNRDPDTLWDALQASYQRFDSDEVPDVEVAVTVAGRMLLTRTDDEGYFRFEFDTPDVTSQRPPEDTLRLSVHLPGHDGEHDRAEALVLLPSERARFGVISDVDDTVLVTRATSLAHMMRLTLLGSARSRVAFDGVAAFYAALHAGVNPFFYVSSSPWNLYDFLDDFLRLKGIVAGPLLLRDLGIDESKFIAGSHHAHKLSRIREVLDCYATLPFVLIGDSGQADAEIYRQVAEAYPGRILAIYIRDVSEAPRDRAVDAHVEALRASGVDMLRVADTAAAARHAASRGWITAADTAEVAAEASMDRAVRHP